MDATATPPAEVRTHAAPPRFEWRTYAGPAGARRYKLYIPAGYDAATPAPLLVFLHGCTQDPDDVARGTRLNEAAEAAGMVVAYPEQPAAVQPQKCWSWYDPANQRRDGGEPAIIAGIAAQVADSLTIDPARVYVGGISAGGAMALAVAAAYPERFAAVAVHSAVPLGAASDVASALAAMQGRGLEPERLRGMLPAGARVPPLLAIHGTSDGVVNPENGRAIAAQWAAARGITQRATDRGAAGGLAFTRTVYGTGEVETLWVEGLGHAWSGGSPEGSFTSAAGPEATAEVVRFLLARRLGAGR